MDLRKFNFILLFLALLVVDTTGNGKILSRKKRWLAFPDGSSVAVSINHKHKIRNKTSTSRHLCVVRLEWLVIPLWTTLVGLLTGVAPMTYLIKHGWDRMLMDSISWRRNQKSRGASGVIFTARSKSCLISKFSVTLKLLWFLFFSKSRMGFNGRDCIGRALCESSKYFDQRKGNMVEELMKTMFRYVETNLFS